MQTRLNENRDRLEACRCDGGGVGVRAGVNASVDSDAILPQACRAAVFHEQANGVDSVGWLLIGAVVTALFRVPAESLHSVACALPRRLDSLALVPGYFSTPQCH